MKVVHFSEVENKIVNDSETKNAKIRWLAGPKDGTENFSMRRIELSEGGNTPWHSHDWEHEVYVIEGSGTLKTEEKEYEIGSGTCIFVKGGEKHQFINKGSVKLAILCMVPNGRATAGA